MKNPETKPQSLEHLKSEQQRIANRIIELDAAGTKNEEWNQLHNEHELITSQIEEMSSKDLDIAA